MHVFFYQLTGTNSNIYIYSIINKMHYIHKLHYIHKCRLFRYIHNADVNELNRIYKRAVKSPITLSKIFSFSFYRLRKEYDAKENKSEAQLV